jgi:hypothetical protein
MRRAALAIVTVLLLAGCGHGGATFAVSQLPSLVLQAKDVGSGYASFDSGPQVLNDQPRGHRDLQRYGRLGGWKARYRRVGKAQTGPLVIESRADVFGDDGGAHKELAAYATQFEPLDREPGMQVSVTRADSPGEESVRIAIRQGRLVYAYVAWREHNVTAAVTASGLAASVSLQDAVRLARKQARRIAPAPS